MDKHKFLKYSDVRKVMSYLFQTEATPRDFSLPPLLDTVAKYVISKHGVPTYKDQATMWIKSVSLWDVYEWDMLGRQ